MIKINVILLALFFLAMCSSNSNSQTQEIEPVQKFSGKNKMEALRTVAPKNGVIKDKKAFQNIWAAWHAGKPLPEIDFEKYLVLVETVGGPNNMFTNAMVLKDGDLKFDVAATRMAGPGFGFMMLVVERNGIVSVNGKPVDGMPEDMRKPGRQNENDGQPASTPMKLRPPRGNSAQPERATEGVFVEVVGRIQMGITAFGNETTGTVIAANGIVWELELGQNDVNKKIAGQLGDSMARVKGRLIRVRGRDVADRMVVRVDSVVPVVSDTRQLGNSQPRINNAQKATDVGDQARMTGIPDKRLDQGSGDQSVGSQGSSEATNQAKDDPYDFPMTGFRSVVVLSQGGSGVGQKQRVARDGTVTYAQSDKKWRVDPERLKNLHAHVERTNWKDVPRISRSGDRNAMQFEVQIETNLTTMRFFIDGPSLGVQKELTELFQLIIPMDNDE